MNDAIPRPARKKTAPPPTRPLDIAVVTHYFGSHGGGIELVTERLIREMASSEFLRFTWMASGCETAPLIDGHKAAPMSCWNAFEKWFGVPWPIWGLRSVRTMKKIIDKADIVWLHDTLYPGNILAFRHARKRRKPIVITQHIGPIPYRNPLLRWAMKAADKFFTVRMLQKANEVVFISDRIAEDYYRRVPFTHAIKVIPNGVDTQTFHPPIPENRRFLRQQFALKKDQPVLLFVGRFVDKKGLGILRRLAAQMPGYRFWLAGTGPIKPENWLLPNVHVFRNRRGASLAELYQAADLLLVPSYGEGFPLVIQEALACGLPVLCSSETAQGSRAAMPYLHLADIWPKDPARSAVVWKERIRSFPIPLPLRTTQENIAEFAHLSWSWRPIADVYANLFQQLEAGSKDSADT